MARRFDLGHECSPSLAAKSHLSAFADRFRTSVTSTDARKLGIYLPVTEYFAALAGSCV
jgi:hypothetical protein